MLAQPVKPVNVFANDPGARGLEMAQVVPPAGKSPFAIPGWTGEGGLFSPGTDQFQAGELHVVLTRTYAVWSDFFEVDFPWQPGFAQLPIVPRAGKDFNAYYDRRGLKFFFNTDPKTGQMIYASESSDIIAHECGHAVLDARHPDYWDSLLAETAAFHEAFGDISALLVTLDDARVRAAILAENAGDLTKSNAVTRLAEQLARGISNAGHAEAVVSDDALRDLVNRFRYRDPDTLPGRAPAARLSSESHSFSRVFSGAFYDLLISIYDQLRLTDATLSPDAALVQARRDAGGLVAQGLVLAPRGDAAFKTVATAMFNADTQIFGSKYYAALRKAFVGRRILKAREAKALRSAGAPVHTKTSAEGLTSAPVGARPSWESPTARIGEDLPSGIRKVIPVPKGEFRLVSEQARQDASRVLNYAATREMELKGKELGAAQGAVIDVADSLAIQVDNQGRLVASHLHQADRGHEERIRDHVAKLIARGRVYQAREGESVDPSRLIERKQPYFVAYDQEGRKRLRRAFIACCTQLSS